MTGGRFQVNDSVRAIRRNAMTAALHIKDLVKRYGSFVALDHIGFDVAPGQVVGLLGPNGAGKTTLFQILTGLFVADSGHVAIHGIDSRTDPVAALARLGIVFQQSALDPDLSARQNLTFHGGLHGLSRTDAHDRADLWLGRFGLAGQAEQPCRQLSGGMKRRVELARALMTNPSLLLLDEPTQGLDPKSRQDLVARIFSLTRDSGLAVLWATHLVGEIRDADEIIVLDRGRIAGRGRAEALCRETGMDDLESAFLVLTQSETETGEGRAP